MVPARRRSWRRNLWLQRRPARRRRRRRPPPACRAGVRRRSSGAGGELHQVAADGGAVLTTNHGMVIADDHNSLKAGPRGPTLLEDFVLREKIFHFDHERIPERIVHARGSGAHGYFERPTTSRRHLQGRAVREGRQDADLRALLDGRGRARDRPTRRATCAASRSNSTRPKATGTSSATTSRCSSSRTRSSSPI